MRAYRRIAFALMATCALAVGPIGLATAADATARPAAAQATKSFDVYSGDKSTEAFGTVAFNSNGSVTVAIDGANHSASGYIPYVDIQLINNNGIRIIGFNESCSASVDQVCSMKTYTSPSDPTVAQVLLQAGRGKGGTLSDFGDQQVVSR